MSKLYFLVFFFLICSGFKVNAVLIFPSELVFNNSSEQLYVKNNIGYDSKYCVISKTKNCFKLKNSETKMVYIQPMDGKVIIKEELDYALNIVEIPALNLNRYKTSRKCIIFLFCIAVLSIFFILKIFKYKKAR